MPHKNNIIPCPRIARERSSIYVYHVILRGVNKQQIFECADDYLYFVRILQRLCGIAREPEMAERRCYVYAYCLMSSHLHLRVKEFDEPIGDVVKRISSAYVFYYNHKYGRIGHLFQERFKSQAVEDLGYFMILLRYIHQNLSQTASSWRCHESMQCWYALHNLS